MREQGRAGRDYECRASAGDQIGPAPLCHRAVRRSRPLVNLMAITRSTAASPPKSSWPPEAAGCLRPQVAPSVRGVHEGEFSEARSHRRIRQIEDRHGGFPGPDQRVTLRGRVRGPPNVRSRYGGARHRRRRAGADGCSTRTNRSNSKRAADSGGSQSHENPDRYPRSLVSANPASAARAPTIEATEIAVVAADNPQGKQRIPYSPSCAGACRGCRRGRRSGDASVVAARSRG